MHPVDYFFGPVITRDCGISLDNYINYRVFFFCSIHVCPVDVNADARIIWRTGPAAGVCPVDFARELPLTETPYDCADDVSGSQESGQRNMLDKIYLTIFFFFPNHYN